MTKEEALEALQSEINQVTKSDYDRHDTLFSADDIEECLGYLYEWTDGYNCAAVVRLKNGHFGAYAAWSDYTGHGCQCDVQTYIEPTLEELFKYHFTYQEIEKILDTFESQQ